MFLVEQSLLADLLCALNRRETAFMSALRRFYVL